ncbi:M23 family metallopeptidase [Kribbella solani]|uniref:M23 family metallopeptidase n=1 Tax=Kribbella solani TaxID=236067 RepID=UPI0029A17FE2|nr:M23 family metallopeptidase [Kribbella solani]MDX2969920.1 M23 family metallopeptidase [Kribbella solani]
MTLFGMPLAGTTLALLTLTTPDSATPDIAISGSAASDSAASNSAASDSAVSDSAVSDWPLRPRPEVVRGFELPAKPWLPGHRGVDLAGRPGQPVLAATTGTITYAGSLAGRGIITLTTGPRRTTYEPVVPTVTAGTTVTTGTVIGHLSAAASHCPPATCLHWGLLQGKQYLNPLTLTPRRPIRLLPLTDPQPHPPGPLRRRMPDTSTVTPAD